MKQITGTVTIGTPMTCEYSPTHKVRCNNCYTCNYKFDCKHIYNYNCVTLLYIVLLYCIGLDVEMIFNSNADSISDGCTDSYSDSNVYRYSMPA